MDRRQEILAKLAQIQEQAQLTIDELPLRLAKDRLRLIIGLAKYLATTIEVKWDPAELTLPGGPPERQPTRHARE